MSARDYMMRVRLLAARHRLELSRAPVGQIALECGFYDQSYFTKCFKSALGMKPLDYRRRFGG
jgi:transcriptional regulator GlxA family with amidase domain